MSFQVTTINRLQARKLLHKCGVDGSRARAMSLRELQAHLVNFVGLGTIKAHEVESALATSTNDIPPIVQGEQVKAVRHGQPWSRQEDRDLLLMYTTGGMTAEQIAKASGRTLTGIEARLQKHGILEYQRATNKMELARDWHDRARILLETQYTQEAANRETRQTQYDQGAIDAIDTALEEVARLENQQTTTQPPAAKDSSVSNDVQSQVAGAIAAALGPLLAGMNKAPELDVAAVRALIAEEVPKHVGAFQRFEIARHDGTQFKVEGLAHHAFPRLLRAVSARTRHDGAGLNIWLYGPAGTGKSTAARKLAEAMQLEFHTNGPVGSQWDIRGFTDAQGKIVETAFRRAWINGGVYCWDEGDGSAPAALIEANGALATGYASFPDGTFKRHKDCIVIINGNLRPGAAPDATYNGRFKQDTAFVNRFVAIEWNIDEELERALLGNLQGEQQKFYALVKKIRARVKERGIKGVVVSPRQTQYGIALIDAGADLQEATESVIKFMFTDEQWSQVAA